ncbi:MAG TPA: hypothetical protein VFX89_23075 [Gammaproteobacteria bacterium]|nr:hypothetical protein [Gammaproteobacteria bacterium]
MIPDLRALPGGDLVMQGLQDLADGTSDSVEALLVQIARPRLATAGLEVPGSARENAELALYSRLSDEGAEDPYAAYNSLLRRLVSCATALEHDLYRREPGRGG